MKGSSEKKAAKSIFRTRKNSSPSNKLAYMHRIEDIINDATIKSESVSCRSSNQSKRNNIKLGGTTKTQSNYSKILKPHIQKQGRITPAFNSLGSFNSDNNQNIKNRFTGKSQNNYLGSQNFDQSQFPNPQQKLMDSFPSMVINLKEIRTNKLKGSSSSDIKISPLKYKPQDKPKTNGAFVNPDDLVYDCFCSKYRKYTKITKPDEDSIALRQFHQQQNKILQKMIRQGLLEENQFRLVSKFYDTYMMMKENPIIKKAKNRRPIHNSFSLNHKIQ